MSATNHRYFLRSKTSVPALREPLVERPQLLSQLNEGIKRALVLVSAPAGSGKSTALAQWAAQSPLPIAWLSLDGGDNDPARFFAYLRLALADRDDELAPSPNAEELPARTLAIAFLGQVERRNSSLAVVLDDYQLINAPTIHEALHFLLEHRPPFLHFIISTRADPPLSLARLRARRELLEVRADELRFTPAEVGTFLNGGMDLNVSEAHIATLAQRTEGWIAGVQLAALSLQGRDNPGEFIDAFSGSHRFILDYLAEEVITRQSPTVRHFLLATSLLERLCSSLCEAVTGEEGAQEMLETIEAANLFLIPLDDRRQWYRYHHLFAELLRARLQQSESAETVAELHRRAAVWYEGHDWPVEAIEHTLSAGDFGRAAEIIERHGHRQWSLSNTGFMRMLGHLPEEMLLQRPILGIYHAWTLIIYGQIPAAERLLRQLAASLNEMAESGEEAGLRAFVDLLLAYTPVMQGAPQPDKLPAASALAQVPETRLGMRNSADVVYAYLLYLRGDLEAAASHLQIPAERDIAVDGATAIPLAISRLAQIRQIQGRLHEAESLCRHYLAYISQRGKERFYTGGNLDLVLGELLRERNELAAAEEHIVAGMKTNDPWRVPHAQATGALARARLQQARGQLAVALETVATMELQIADRVILPALQSEIQAFKVRLWLQSGDLERTRAWANGLRPLPSLSFARELELVALARVWLATGQVEEAQQLLGRLAEAAAAGGRDGRLLEIDLLRAVADREQGRDAAALQKLVGCLRRAAPQGYVRLFVDEGPAVRELLVASLAKSPPGETAYARRLLRAFPEAEESLLQPVQDLLDPLTPRELEVLHLICEGYSNQTIADRLTVTVSTVKKHCSNVYGKLGVESRAQAMVRARELRLVPPVDPTI